MSLDESTEQSEILTRLDAIEARLSRLEGSRRLPAPERTPVREVVPEPVEVPAAPFSKPPLFKPPPPPPDVPEPDSHPHLETQVGLTWLNRIGVLTVVLGIAFFFKYAVDNRLIGETGRVILGVFIAFASLALAEFMWRRDHRVYAQGITGAGIAILYLSLYASFGFYHLLPQFAAFLLMFLATTLAVALALRYNSIAIAALGFIGGYLTPLLLSTDERRPWTLFGYLLILQAGGIALVRDRSWRLIEPLILAGTALVYLASGMADNELAATVSVLTFYTLFWIVSSRAILVAAHILTVLAVASLWRGPEPQSLWINLGVAGAGLFAVQRRSWPRLALVALSLFWFAAVLWVANGTSTVSVLALTALTAAFLLFLVYAYRQLTATDTPGNSETNLAILAIDGLAYFGVCYSLLNPAYHAFLGPLAVLLAVVYLFVAWLIGQELEPDFKASADLASERFRPILLAIGIALTFLTLAIPIQLSGYRITMSWAIEGAAFTWIAARTGNKRFGSTALFIFGLAFLRVYSFDGPMYLADVPHALLVNSRFLTMLVTGICFWLGALWMKKGPPASVLYIAGHFVTLWAVMAETLDWAGQRTSMGDPSSIGTVSASILLAIYGIVLVTLGVSNRSVVNRVLGLILLAVVILKLYGYDVWQLQETFRIVAFVVLGVLLLAASFLYSRFRAVVEKLWDSTPSSEEVPK